jgi:alkanesulfonate monooxygenase SsuD/methylene tetrahydromethanopterin reductase-like flavin-dependent oxidoreductase (luciferase family)
MRALWAGESVSLDGRWKFADAKISPLPPAAIEVWIGASAPVAIDRAARMGDAWLADPSMTLQQAATAMEIYKAALTKHGKVMPDTIAIRRDIHVSATADEEQQVKDQVSRQGYRGFDHKALVIGQAQEVAENFRAFEDLGYTDIIVRNLHSDPESAVKSTERLQEVIEVVNT